MLRFVEYGRQLHFACSPSKETATIARRKILDEKLSFDEVEDHVSEKSILKELSDGILTITLNRPDRMNAWTDQMFAQLLDAFDYADANDEVGVVILTGAGRAFCAGADLVSSEAFAATSNQAKFADLGDSGGAMTRRIFRCLKPVIVAFNGPAVGVGLTMTLSADVRLAARDIKMGFVFAARGILPEGCSSWFLPRLIGISQALELCYTGKIFKSEDALGYGLVRSLHDPEDLLPAARALANEFLQTSAVSKAVLRQMFWRMLGESDPAVAHALDSKGMAELGASADATEGTASFLEKRKAVFPGKVSKDLPSFMPWWTDGTKLN